MAKELHPAAKAEIINYTVIYSKGLIEDDMACPRVCGGIDRQEIKPDDLEDFVEKCRDALLELVKTNKL